MRKFVAWGELNRREFITERVRRSLSDWLTRTGVILGLLLSASVAHAQTPEAIAWAEARMPEVDLVGEHRQEHLAIKAELRAFIVRMLAYMHELGMTDLRKLDRAEAITTYRGLSVRQFFAQLNPELTRGGSRASRLVDHVAQQWRAVEQSGLPIFVQAFLPQFRAELGVDPIDVSVTAEHVLSSLFDTYASQRYGHGIAEFRQSIVEDRPMLDQETVAELAMQGDPQRDNAYFWSPRRFDLTEVLLKWSDVPMEVQLALTELARQTTLREEAIQKELAALGIRLGASAKANRELLKKSYYDRKLADAAAGPEHKKALAQARREQEYAAVKALRSIRTVLPYLIDFDRLGSSIARRRSYRVRFLPRTTETADDAQLLSVMRALDVGGHELTHHVVDFVTEPVSAIQRATRAGHHPRMLHETDSDYFVMAVREDPKIGAVFAKDGALIAERLLARDDASDPFIQQLARSFQRMAKEGSLRDMSQNVTFASLERHYQMPNDYDAGNPLRNFQWRVRQSLEPELKKAYDAVVLGTIEALGALPMLVAPNTERLLQLRQVELELEFEREAKRIELEALARGESLEAKVLIQQTRASLARKERVLLEANATLAKQDGGRERRPAILADYLYPEYYRALVATAQSSQALSVTDRARVLMRIQDEASRTLGRRGQWLRVKLEDGVQINTLVFADFGIDGSAIASATRARVTELLATRYRVLGILQGLEAAYAQASELPSEVKATIEALKTEYALALERLAEFERTGDVRDLDREPGGILAPLRKLVREVTRSGGVQEAFRLLTGRRSLRTLLGGEEADANAGDRSIGTLSAESLMRLLGAARGGTPGAKPAPASACGQALERSSTTL